MYASKGGRKRLEAFGTGFTTLEQHTNSPFVKAHGPCWITQVINGFKDVYIIKWPPTISAVLGKMKVFNFDLFSFGNIACQIPSVATFYTQFVFTFFLPMFCIGLIVVITVVRNFVVKSRRQNDTEPHARLMHLLSDINFRGEAFSKGFLVRIWVGIRDSRGGSPIGANVSAR